MKRFVLFLLVFCLTSSVQADVLLKEDTPVRLSLIAEVSSAANQPGDTVDLKVVDDVYADDNKTIIIPSGAKATGVISEMEERGRIGRQGSIVLTVESATGINGKKIPLRSNPVSKKGRNKTTSSVALAVFVPGGPLWLLKKGKDAVIPVGFQVNAYVVRDVVIESP